MQITCYGAAGEVTGSCYLVETGRSRVLVDCGMFQGSQKVEKLNRIPKGLGARSLDAVVLTHAHLDHVGRLPLLVKAGYSGPVYATDASIDVARLILSDAAKIQAQDAERATRLNRRSGLGVVDPLYEIRDVEKAVGLMRRLAYDQRFEIAAGVTVRPVEAGHILGSSSIELTVSEPGGDKKLVFSGDVGPFGAPIMRDPAQIGRVDAVIMESTYGDRDHRPLSETVAEFEQLVKLAVEKRGRMLIPTFAVGRAQQILYHVAQIFRKGEIKPFPVYLDSPMAIAATELYRKHRELMDEEATRLTRTGQLERDLSTLVKVQSADESRALNNVEGPCMILAGAGMCNAGRILHHLRHSLWNPATVVMIVGYQARGSLGRLLVDGAPRVKIFGETIAVKATVRGLGGFSAHAGQSDLIRWLEPMAVHRPRVIVTHGEDHPRHELAHLIRQRFDIEAELPRLGEVMEI